MSEALQPAPQPNQNEALSRAIEAQIGSLTCQLIELNVRLQAAQQEMGLMAQALAERDAEIAALKASSEIE